MPRCLLLILLATAVACGDTSNTAPRSAPPPDDETTNRDLDAGTPDSDGGYDPTDVDVNSDSETDAGLDEGCDEPGATWCFEGHHQVCYQGQRVDSYLCPGESCLDDASCQADTCASAMHIQPGTSDNSTIIDGHRRGTTHSGFFSDQSGCLLDNISTDASDIFLFIDELPDGQDPGGQDLIIESLAQGTYGFFILAGCDAEKCLAVGSQDDEFQNRLRWTIDDHESVIIVIRPSDTVQRSFAFALYFAPTSDE